MMTTNRAKEAVETLARLVNTGSGASRAAASVLLYAWNPIHPIRDLWTLDLNNFQAALTVIAATYQGEVFKGGDLVPEWSGLEMSTLAQQWGKNGEWWEDD